MPHCLYKILTITYLIIQCLCDVFTVTIIHSMVAHGVLALSAYDRQNIYNIHRIFFFVRITCPARGEQCNKRCSSAVEQRDKIDCAGGDVRNSADSARKWILLRWTKCCHLGTHALFLVQLAGGTSVKVTHRRENRWQNHQTIQNDSKSTYEKPHPQPAWLQTVRKNSRFIRILSGESDTYWTRQIVIILVIQIQLELVRCQGTRYEQRS